MPDQPSKKKHHYVPVTYLRRFTNADGILFAYRKDAPDKVLLARPENVGFQNYYYSQPLPEGGQNNNALEDFFSTIETRWPALCSKLSAGDRIIKADMIDLHMFIALQRARVPAARDVVERALAHDVMKQLLAMEEAGQLPPPPKEFPNLLDQVEVSIDPHQSIHAMTVHMRALGPLLDSIGYEILHNETGLSFITSDNPVAYFDPTVSEKAMVPYGIKPAGPCELIFPITPTVTLHGHPSLRDRFVRRGPRHTATRSEEVVRRINRISARFAYREIFAADRQHDALVRAYAETSPTVIIRDKAPGSAGRFDLGFGQRAPKPKWKK